MDRELLPILLGPLITAAVAAAGVWFRDWRERRDDDAQRRRTLGVAREQVSFIREWLEAHDRVADESAEEEVRTRAQLDLEQAYVDVAQSLANPVRGREPLTLGKMVRSLLLRRPLQDWRARIVRALYYLGLAWAGLWAAVGAEQTAREDFTPSGIFAAIVLILFLGIAPAWALRKWALWIENRHAAARHA